LTSAADNDRARLANLIGAWTVAVADRVHAAASAAAGREGQVPAALVALHEFSNGRPIEHLRSVLGLSHSATVRLVDTLEADKLAIRRRATDDQRSVAVTLTAAGRRRAAAVARARQEAIGETFGGLSSGEQETLTDIMERLVADMTSLRLQERQQGNSPGAWLCRLCDFQACGRERGACPAAATASSGSM